MKGPRISSRNPARLLHPNTGKENRSDQSGTDQGTAFVSCNKKTSPFGATRERTMQEPDREYLEARIRYLEEVTRHTMDALEMAASLGDFQTSINRLQAPSLILDESGARIQSLIQFEASAFYLIEEETNDFYLAKCQPPEISSFVQDEIDSLIENGTFAWALHRKRSVVVPSSDKNRLIFLHAMATSSRSRGMFVGVIIPEREHIPDVSMAILSIILLNTANALESFELYSMIRKITENLRRKENYRILFEAAPDGVEVLDARGIIIDCNQSFQNLTRYARDKILGRHTSSFFPEKDAALQEEYFSRLRKQGYLERKMDLLRSDGTFVPVWRKEKAIYDEAGGFAGAVVYNHDMSALREAEKQKAKLEAQLQRAQKMEALGALAGGIAHDLNNILGGLVSYPELILMQMPEDSPLRRPIQIIQRSGEKAAAIVQDLLTLARREVAVKEVINLNDLIRDYFSTPVHRRLESLYPAVKFETHLDHDLLNIKGSAVHLYKTVMNLVSNAAEAIPETGTVTVRTENRHIDKPINGYESLREGDYVVLSVSDTGVGIAAADLERIFEPFYTKKVLGRSGSGIGLAVVWGTVKDHFGYIDVKSSEENGTTFTLFFPVTREERLGSGRELPLEEYCGNGEKILVVDDVEDQRELATQMLKLLGYDVFAVGSGEEAIEYLKDNSADLLVLDMVMDPGIDGLETYKRVLELHPGQRAILVSGYSESERVQEAQRLGAGAYVKKPFLLQTFGVAVMAELSKRQS